MGIWCGISWYQGYVCSDNLFMPMLKGICLTLFFPGLQVQPGKLCSNIGLCLNGTQPMRLWKPYLFSYYDFFILSSLYSIQNLNLCSKIIETKVEVKSGKKLAVGDDLLCTACEMTAIWIHSQLKQNNTKTKIFEYVNKVIFPHPLLFVSLIQSLIFA